MTPAIPSGYGLESQNEPSQGRIAPAAPLR